MHHDLDYRGGETIAEAEGGQQSMAARHVSVEWHGPSPLSPSAMLVAMGSTTTKGDEDDLVGGKGRRRIGALAAPLGDC